MYSKLLYQSNSGLRGTEVDRGLRRTSKDTP